MRVSFAIVAGMAAIVSAGAAQAQMKVGSWIVDKEKCRIVDNWENDGAGGAIVLGYAHPEVIVLARGSSLWNFKKGQVVGASVSIDNKLIFRGESFPIEDKSAIGFAIKAESEVINLIMNGKTMEIVMPSMGDDYSTSDSLDDTRMAFSVLDDCRFSTGGGSGK
jgi:hypothetical protein